MLRDQDVEFVVIGGFALAFHGAPRATKDVDIVPEQSPENLERLWRALASVHAEPGGIEGIEPGELPVEWSLQGLVDGGGNWIVETDLGRVDIMQWVEGIESYESLRAHSDRYDVPEIGGDLYVAGFEDLLAMKEAAGRDQDLIDITRLRMARGLEE